MGDDDDEEEEDVDEIEQRRKSPKPAAFSPGTVGGLGADLLHSIYLINKHVISLLYITRSYPQPPHISLSLSFTGLSGGINPYNTIYPNSSEKTLVG